MDDDFVDDDFFDRSFCSEFGYEKTQNSCHTLRQEYAKVALEGLLSNPENKGRWDPAGVAHEAFRIAEAMILEDSKYD